MQYDTTDGTLAPRLTIRLCVPDDQKKYLPRRPRAPETWPPHLPFPRVGEVIYLAPGSVWAVQLVVHEWQEKHEMQIEVWLEHVSSSRHSRPSGFALTQ